MNNYIAKVTDLLGKLIITIGIVAPFAASASTRVSLLTVAPGEQVYELDGHTALRFTEPGGSDYIVNWGVFDFNSPNFLYRFVKGETDYMAWPFYYEDFIEEYRRSGREVTEQVLDLTPLQTERLKILVQINLLPQNRTYRYNYIYDNCATRPLLLIEEAIGYQINIPPTDGFVYGETGITDPGGEHTFRGEMTRSHADYPWYQFGIDLALGSGLDKTINPRQRAYSPLYMKEALRNATYTDSAGVTHPVVKSTDTILPGVRVSRPATPWYLTPMAASILFLLLTLFICLRDIRRMTISRWFDTAVYGCFFIVSLLLTFLIFVSVHEATSPNWLYLWLNPLCIIPAALIWIKSCNRAVYCYQICNFAALTALMLLGICGIQGLNNAFYLLIAADMALSARYLYISVKRKA